jgi:ADP-ribose pyrophosphatase YjhB (NUDIX family)
MTENGANRFISPRVWMRHEQRPIVNQESSQAFLSDLLVRLKYGENFLNFEEQKFTYTTPFATVVNDFPKQAVGMIAMIQPEEEIDKGLIRPQSPIVVTKRAAEHTWGANSWAIPMGYMDREDGHNGASWAEAIQTTAARELSEEVKTSKLYGNPKILGSYRDTSTNFLMHVVIGSIEANNLMTVHLPDTDEQEHSEVGWTKVTRIPDIYPMEPGTKFMFHTAFNTLLEKAREV